MELLVYIVGNFIWVFVFLFVENEFCFGVVVIFVNIELIIWVYLILRNCSWFWENENCDGDVKVDLKVVCCFLDLKICLVLFFNLLVLLEGFVCVRRMLWVFLIGYLLKIVMYVRSSL